AHTTHQRFVVEMQALHERSSRRAQVPGAIAALARDCKWHPAGSGRARARGEKMPPPARRARRSAAKLRGYCGSARAEEIVAPPPGARGTPAPVVARRLEPQRPARAASDHGDSRPALDPAAPLLVA